MIEGVLSTEYPMHRDKIWPFLEGFARRDLDGMTAHEMEQDILNRETQVWNIRNFQAVCITRVTRDAIRIERCAGVRRHEWEVALDEELTAWGRALGKKRIIGVVRPGWAKFAVKRGYREKHRELVRGL